VPTPYFNHNSNRYSHQQRRPAALVREPLYTLPEVAQRLQRPLADLRKALRGAAPPQPAGDFPSRTPLYRMSAWRGCFDNPGADAQNKESLQ
jgi:hypothetical protein